MNCHTCGYALWNLRTRQCPECGERFAPSDFEFIANAVAFCCPHCDQPYYGIGEKGHLVPQAFTCVKCGQPVYMDLMVVRPSEGVREDETRVGRVPWLQSEEGFLKRLFKTIWAALIAPHRLGMAMRADQSIGQAWLFAAVAITLTTLATLLPCIGFFAIIFAAGGPGGGVGAGGMFMVMPLFFMFFIAWVVTFLGIVYWGGLAHLLLKMTGETQSPIGRTFECICYSSGANMTSAVPCIGYYFGWIWWVVSAVLCLKEGQRVSGGRAALAGVVPPVVGLLVLMGGYVGMMFFALTAAGGAGVFATAPAVPPPAAPVEVRTATRDLGQNISAFSWRGPPGHAIELLESGFASPATFIVDTSRTTYAGVPLGDSHRGVTLAEFESLDAEEREQVVAQTIAQLPENVIAHRLGDFVFTWHGVDTSGGGDPRLWFVIASPNPDANDAESFDGILVVACSWGRTESILEERFEEELAEQNRIRAQHGLAPLPHPRDVTHAQPAIGEQRPQRRR